MLPGIVSGQRNDQLEVPTRRDMFAEPIYVKAYQRGVFQAAKTFCDLYSRGHTPVREWPRARSEATSLVEDLAPCDETMLRRLTSLAHAGSKIEWRHLTEALV